MNPYNPDRPPPDFQPNLPSDRTGSEGDMRGAGAQFTGPSMQHPLTTHNEDGDIDFQRRMQNLEIDPTQPTYHPHQSPPEEQPYQPFPQTFYPPPHNLQYPAYSYSAYPGSSPINPSPVQPYGLWTSPPMSPAMSSTPYRPSGPPSAMHRHGSVGDYGAFYGTPRGSYSGGPPSTWTSPSMPSTYGFYTPQQQQQPTMEPRINDWGQAPPNYRGQAYRRDGRQSWSGPSRMTKEIAGPQEKEKEQERKAYHPQAPARRSDWVMWVGNVPPNTSHEELWRFFNNTIPQTKSDTSTEPWRGPSSIFLISRSSCAFVNLSSQTDLDRAVSFFNGKPLRPWDPRCPRMLCRIRRKDDDLRSGVGAQRGTGMHRDWVKEQEVKLPRQTSTASVSSANSVPPSPAILEHPPEGEGRRRESIIKEGREPIKHHQSSGSFASTNSSFLARHFPKRIFILKSLTTAELEESVQTGTWKTQGHNEPILDQAFRTSQEVFLIFGANRSGEFFGYAKMIEPIDKDKDRAKKAQSHSLSKSRPPIAHAESESRPPFFLTPSQSHLASSSPGELTPNEEANLEHAIGARRTDPSDVRNKSPNNKSIQSAPEYRAQTLDPKALQHDYFPPVPITAANAGEGEAQHQEQLGGSQRQPSRDESGVLRKDTLLTPDEKAEREEEEGHDEFLEETRGHVFRIEWIKVGPVPFNKTRHLRNPWNADREVKVSRDGTEVEPSE
uniref:YTH domain-containing protein n=1 Tax=Kwoniella dejecticola CBS 10117 TaxID=1296121 RepID=A0A1A6A2I5_9TREE|nr:uncharacterized protein I303_05128 [Kwoniella dejecticola CBS 10117]OBR84271.1 hypothetical protein I303_05128 [Kwoniella dejecticola CBS 10117]